MRQNGLGTRPRGAVCTLAAAVAIAAILIAGCGVKGPLKLPPAAPGSAPSTNAPPAQPPEAMPSEPPSTSPQPAEPRKP